MVIETNNNAIGIFIAISKNWPLEQRKKFLEKINREKKMSDKEKEEFSALMAGTLGELKQVKKPKEANDG